MDAWIANTEHDFREPQEFVLAHLSDPHLSALSYVRLRELLNKRVLGYFSWRWRRRREHRPEILAALQRDLETRQPDHIAVTGDFTHLGTPAECREVKAWLETLGPPSRVSTVPGNHDTYVSAPWAQTVGLWKPYMTSEVSGSSVTGIGPFPFVRRRGPLAIIGLSTAQPTAPFLASGRLGRRQLAAVEKILVNMKHEGRFRVLLLHHPPVSGVVTRRKALHDADALGALLARVGAEFILHGHVHRTLHSTLEVPGGRAPVIGVRSASILNERPEQHAAYHLYRITRSSEGWRLGVEERRLEPSSRTFQSMAKREILLPLQEKAQHLVNVQ